MKQIVLLILISSFFISVNAQQFSYSGYNDVFENAEILNQKSDTSFLITHSVSQIIDVGTSVSCNSNGIHFENSYYRVFDLIKDPFYLNGDFSVQALELGIGFAESGIGTSQPASLMLWTMSEYDETNINPDSLTFKTDSIFININNSESGTIKTIPVEPAISIPHGTVLVVEVLLPYIEGDNHKFYIGSNDLGQTDNTYIRAPECGIDKPIDVEEIGFGDMHLVLNVIGAYDAATPAIISFSIEGQLTDTIINDPEYLINVVMPADSALDDLTPEISVPQGFYISPGSGEIVDFSLGAVEYIVTNEYNKISQSWFASVTNAGPDIIDVQLSNQNDEPIIDNESFTVTVSVPFGTDLTDLSPEITIYAGFTIEPESEVSQDFSLGAVIYTVAHETLPITQDWEISVIESAGAGLEFISNDITIYPNPASDFISVSGTDIIKIDIINSLGMHIFSSNEEIINTSKLPDGIYLLKVQTEAGLILKKILILK